MVNQKKNDKAGDNASKLDNITGDDNGKERLLTDYLKLPQEIKKRVNALKYILRDYINIESEFYAQVFEIEKTFMQRYDTLLDKRTKIIVGEIEPTEEESIWKYSQKELADDLIKQLIELKTDDLHKDASICKGIPNFWLKVMLHASSTADLIQENDHDILKHLIDVRVKLNADESEMGFSIHFHFSSNEYFDDPVLSKSYYYNNKPAADSPLDYDGPQIVRVRASPISWKPGKNVTVKFIKKVKKHKNRKEVRTITKSVKQDSFFNYFDPPFESLTDENLDEDTRELLQEDIRIATFIKDIMIPQAVLIFTGEAEESDEDDGEDDEDDDFDDEDDGGSEIDLHQQKNFPNRSRDHDLRKTSEEMPECRQS